MLFYKEESGAIFIDGDHVNAAAQVLNFTIDYKILFEIFAGRMRLIRAYYYSIAEEPVPTLIELRDCLHYYALVVKPPREFTDAIGRVIRKSNMNMELAIDVMSICDRLDHIVIFAGDEDFCRLVELAQMKGTRTSVVSTIRCSPPMITTALRQQADNYIDLADLRPHIEYTDNTRESPSAEHTETYKSSGVAAGNPEGGKSERGEDHP